MAARAAAWIFLSFVALYLATTRGHFISTDEVAVYQTTRSLWEERSLAIPGVLTSSYPGRDGHRYAVQSVGPAFAALPLYGAGKATRRLLEAAGLDDWKEMFAGPVVERAGHVRWGGEVEIFFVNLFNVLTTALLCAVFFALSLQLGASPRWAVAATACLGITSYVAPFATGFFHHSSEALLLLSSFYFLRLDARRPDWRVRALAGAMAGLMLLVRFQSVVALPALGLYLFLSEWKRTSAAFSVRGRLLSAARAAAAFAVPVAAGFALHICFNYVKWQELTLAGPYFSQFHFKTPLLRGLYGLLLSPGESVLLFTPLLLLTPWTLRYFARRHRNEAVFALVLSASYLLLYAKYEFWHGMWYFGPRFLMPLVPVLLLPLGPWMQSRGRRAWLAVGALCAVGFWVQLVHVGPNFWSVALHERYIDFRPELGFLFIPEHAPIVAHSRALLAWDGRVDMWLVEVYRRFGAGRALVLSLPLLGLLWMSMRNLVGSLRDAGASPKQSEIMDVNGRRSVAAAAVALVVLATILAVAAIDRGRGAGETTSEVHQPTDASEESLMERGLEALYRDRRSEEAAELFRRVLELNPTHYGATFQLAKALDASGKVAEARLYWVRALQMAESYADQANAEIARRRLASGQ